MEQVWAW
jgi:hypothetical protein